MAKKSPPPPTIGGFGALADALRAQGLASAAAAEPVPAAPPSAPEAPPAGKVLVRRETKGRAGKTVTVVHNPPFRGVALGAWVTKVRIRLGTGASIAGDTVVIQGDHVAKVLALLEDPSP